MALLNQFNIPKKWKVEFLIESLLQCVDLPEDCIGSKTLRQTTTEELLLRLEVNIPSHAINTTKRPRFMPAVEDITDGTTPFDYYIRHPTPQIVLKSESSGNNVSSVSDIELLKAQVQLLVQWKKESEDAEKMKNAQMAAMQDQLTRHTEDLSLLRPVALRALVEYYMKAEKR